MTMEIPNTVDNRALTAAVRSRINADARIISAKAAGWRLFGVGSMIATAALGVGFAVGVASFGYAYVHDPRTSMEKMATAIATALNDVKLKGEVTVSGTVPLDTNGVSVKLDPNSTVKLDPNSTVRSTGRPELRSEGRSEVPGNLRRNLTGDQGGKIVTNYSLFKKVDFARGFIVTEWQFADSADAVPNHQGCYYQRPHSNGILNTVDNGPQGGSQKDRVYTVFARNGALLPGVKLRDVDINEALSKCIWYN